MTAEELREEGNRLARPCVWLRRTGSKGDVGAAWGGPGIVPAPAKTLRHWLSVDCFWYKEVLHRYGHKIGPPAGVLSVYTDDNGGGVAVHDRKAKFAVKRGAVALHAHPGRSKPPLEAVFLLGSPAVKAWLKANKWKAEWGYNNNFKDNKPADQYLREYQELSPVYGSFTADAVLGGWHFPWPDGDWADRAEDALLVWTFKDSEPWVEAWADGKSYEVKQRIT
jgi:hypothetical protein